MAEMFFFARNIPLEAKTDARLDQTGLLRWRRFGPFAANLNNCKIIETGAIGNFVVPIALLRPLETSR